MFTLTEKLKKEIVGEVSLLADVNDGVGIRLGDNKALFFQVVDYGDGKEYLIELNDVVDDAFEPCAKYNASAPFGDMETLIKSTEWYLSKEYKKDRKKKKIDFVLRENDDEVLIFRFYPRSSCCHSHNCLPPTKWEEVYKVYYSYAVILKHKDDRESRILFNSGCDECSSIDEVAERCILLSEGKKTVTVRPFDGEEREIDLLDNEIMPTGMGVFWTISEMRDDYYNIQMFDWDDVGFRFILKKEKMKEFGEYLNECCEYMLAHGDPI